MTQDMRYLPLLGNCERVRFPSQQQKLNRLTITKTQYKSLSLKELKIYAQTKCNEI